MSFLEYLCRSGRDPKRVIVYEDEEDIRLARLEVLRGRLEEWIVKNEIDRKLLVEGIVNHINCIDRMVRDLVVDNSGRIELELEGIKEKYRMIVEGEGKVSGLVKEIKELEDDKLLSNNSLGEKFS